MDPQDEINSFILKTLDSQDEIQLNSSWNTDSQDEMHEVGPTTVRPTTTNQNKDVGSTRVLLRLVCCVELTPGRLAWSRTLAPLLQNKTEISLFHSWLIFSVFHLCTFTIVAFLPCVPTWCLLAGAYKMSELKWIEITSFHFENMDPQVEINSIHLEINWVFAAYND